MMTSNDAGWIAEVKRWYFSVRPTAPTPPVEARADDTHEIGYEAADPQLQSRDWPDAAGSAPADPS